MFPISNVMRSEIDCFHIRSATGIEVSFSLNWFQLLAEAFPEKIKFICINTVVIGNVISSDIAKKEEKTKENQFVRIQKCDISETAIRW